MYKRGCDRSHLSNIQRVNENKSEEVQLLKTEIDSFGMSEKHEQLKATEDHHPPAAGELVTIASNLLSPVQ